MTDWRRVLTRFGHTSAATVEEHFDALRLRLRNRLGRTNPVMIMPYRGFGTPETVWLKGRVLEDKGLRPAEDRDTVWQNLLAAYRRFETDEIPGVRVRAACYGDVQDVVTDDEGYFEVRLTPSEPLPEDGLWHDVALELLDEVTEGQRPVCTTGQVLVPPDDSAFGVISDVDDTILQTDATNLLRMAQVTFLNNARTRLPFEGVGALYQALHRGPEVSASNPLFFVSSSPWNLYDLLVEFCAVHDIPAGPFLLRDFGLDQEKFIKIGHDAHKLAQIERILAAYPALPFILLGDSGQHDPEIYQQAVRDFPGRIRAIYIRDVSRDARRGEAVDAIATSVRAAGVEMVLVPDSAAAAEHAAEHGFIHPDTLPSIHAEQAQDEAAPGPVEQLLGLEEEALSGS